MGAYAKCVITGIFWILQQICVLVVLISLLQRQVQLILLTLRFHIHVQDQLIPLLQQL